MNENYIDYFQEIGYNLKDITRAEHKTRGEYITFLQEKTCGMTIFVQ